MRIAYTFSLVFVTIVGACAQFPALDRVKDPSKAKAPYPVLLPFEQLQPGAPLPMPEMTAEELAARSAALRTRADALITGQ